MLRKFYPRRTADSVHDIDYVRLYQEGFRGIIFDIDNTLVEHGADADQMSMDLLGELKKIGFNLCLISNNDEERVMRFNKDIKINYIFNGHKPSKKSYLKAVDVMNTTIDTTVFIGDQLFTDIYGANRIDMVNYHVKPISPSEEIQIVFKRKLEKIVLYFYNKSFKDK